MHYGIIVGANEAISLRDFEPFVRMDDWKWWWDFRLEYIFPSTDPDFYHIWEEWIEKGLRKHADRCLLKMAEQVRIDEEKAKLQAIEDAEKAKQARLRTNEKKRAKWWLDHHGTVDWIKKR